MGLPASAFQLTTVILVAIFTTYVRKSRHIALVLTYLMAIAGILMIKLLPTAEKTSSAEGEKAFLESSTYPTQPTHDATSSHSSTSSNRSNTMLQSRTSANARTRGGSPNGNHLPPGNGSYAYPLIQHAGYYGSANDDDEKKSKQAQSRSWGNITTNNGKGNKKGFGTFLWELSSGLATVAVFVFAWYFWLIWRW